MDTSKRLLTFEKYSLNCIVMSQFRKFKESKFSRNLDGFWFMVFNATFNNILVISWLSVLLVEETGVTRNSH